MYSKLFIALAACAVAVRADFTYQQTSKVTGGAMAGMVRMAGAFSKTAREPMESTVIVKGDCMATVSREHIQVIDLSREMMTDIDLGRKTYSTMTFAEMADAMKRMADQMGQKSGDARMNLKAEVVPTGNTRVISGFKASEMLMTLTVEGTDTKTGNSGAMDMQVDMWLAPDVPGYNEVRDFHRKMAAKMNWSPMAGAFGRMMNQNPKGMSEIVKQMSKLDGVPVLQVTKLGAAGVNGSAMPSEAQQQGTQSTATPDATSQATQAAAASILGRTGRVGALAGGLGGPLGGFGGFGRKKKQEQEQAAAAPAPAAQPAPASAPGAPMMELTTELTNFSSASADTSKFEVPAGFKQVENEMKKALQ